MEFSIDKQTFQKMIVNVKPALEASAEVPIQGLIKIDISDNKLSLLSYNGKLTILNKIDITSTSDGSAVVSGKSLVDVVNVLTGSLTIKKDGNKLRLNNNKSAIGLAIMEEAAFPLVADYDAQNFSNTYKGFFAEVKKASFCASKEGDSNRSHLTGVHFNGGAMIGCDGHRMAVRAHNLSFDKIITVSAESLNKISKIFKDDEDIRMAVGDSEIHFNQEYLYATVRLLVEKYPNFKNLIPQTPYDEIKMSKKEIEAALTTVCPLTDKESTTVFRFTPGKLLVVASSPLGEAKHEIEADCANATNVALNAKFILEAIKHLDSDIVLMELRDGNQPIVIKEARYIHVIMPRRLPDAPSKGR
jgi:DNA polymerase III subunit beta